VSAIIGEEGDESGAGRTGELSEQNEAGGVPSWNASGFAFVLHTTWSRGIVSRPDLHRQGSGCPTIGAITIVIHDDTRTTPARHPLAGFRRCRWGCRNAKNPGKSRVLTFGLL
jgi:hypothetical protein